MSIKIVTGDPIWDEFASGVEYFLKHDRSDFIIDGRKIGGYRSPDTPPVWLRDHTHQMKGFKYFDPEVTSAMDLFCQTQMPDGSFYDLFEKTDGIGPHDPSYHCVFYDAINHILYERVTNEADVEYLAVQAVHNAWQATGNDEWMKEKLFHLERGLAYSMTHPYRWSEEYQLIKRDFTIDTWDFGYGTTVVTSKGSYHRSEVDENTLWGIMHGDNSGMLHSSSLMSKMYRYLGNEERAEYWREKAGYFRRRTNEVCWNGKFYTHQVHIIPVDVDIDESQQLSLSNTFDMNRGLPEHNQCVSIIKEYQKRRETNKGTHFAEWLSIDPPFSAGSFGKANHPPGNYINGGILPLVGGELSRACFEHGFENYGVDILRRYYELAIRPRESYLWYYPDGSHPTHILSTDGWGSTAMLYSMMEGLAGIEDCSKLYHEVRLSPRWLAAKITKAEVKLSYANSGASFDYTWQFDPQAKTIDLEFLSNARKVDFHVLLPSPANKVRFNGKEIAMTNSQVEESHYADFVVKEKKGKVTLLMG